MSNTYESEDAKAAIRGRTGAAGSEADTRGPDILTPNNDAHRAEKAMRGNRYKDHK